VAAAIESKSNSDLSAVEADASDVEGVWKASRNDAAATSSTGGGVTSTAATVEVCWGVLKTVGVGVCGGGGSAIVDGDKTNFLFSFLNVQKPGSQTPVDGGATPRRSDVFVAHVSFPKPVR
jgi:hypothetical protein